MIKEIAITDCMEGDIIAEDVVNCYGGILVARETVLNQYILGKLQRRGIYRIRVYEKRNYTKEKKADTYIQLKKSYKEDIIEVKKILCNLAVGKGLDIEKIADLSDRICGKINNAGDILMVLREEKGFDEYTYSHSLNVALYSMLIGKWLGLNYQEIKEAVVAGLLHDIGKTKIPTNILNKKEILTSEEFELIKKHTLYGYKIITKAGNFSENICEAVLSHHERMDGSGYPNGIWGDQISLLAKIVAVSDVYDAMTTDRVYKKKITPFKAFQIFQTLEVKNLDPLVMKTFLMNISPYYVGTNVLLNTGEIAKVAYIPPQCITEPVVCIGKNYIDCSSRKDIEILNMV
ncbi:HD family phosphohydrolase [Anaerocolumna cellulosilytica]|uniref:HD family phosphohydrolase n=1 Tax=Anaerocolumna cellulosilytica TaxID=433286 RepID=A0A6S6R9P8_9FIRM|nr:HD-GYP domain-containing protein [Anaerocolumna cellulosilytica]MBB5196501.1 putative nucleotidyltransferase with HDIG domain [Anaerocolumna cellulosilytica]BCJ95601.1 HD family phosphohydrolase [Anaerocolumna cellulosilytica]